MESSTAKRRVAVKQWAGVKNRVVPTGTCSFFPLFPGTAVPGFHMLPLLGFYRIASFQFFSNIQFLRTD
jgi:hypothetical protein